MHGPSPASPGRSARVQRARVLSFFFFGGSAIGLLAVAVLPLPAGTNTAGTLVTLGLSLALGTVLLIRPHRIPDWALNLALAAGTAVISFDVYFAGDVQTNIEMFYLWVAFYAFYFLSLRLALVQLGVLAAGYGVALVARGEADAVTRWTITIGTLALAGILIARLVGQIQAWATHSAQREEQLRQAEERFRSAFDDAAIGMALTDLDGRWMRVNRALADLMGYPAQDLVGKASVEFTHAEDLEADLEAHKKLVTGALSQYQTETRYVHADGHTVWIGLSASLVRDRKGQPVHLIAQMQDISERKAAEQELTARALQDPLTSLPNRLLFIDRAQVALARMERPHSSLAVFFLDVDRFKLVNDSLGHAAGDRLLVEVAERLRTLLRPSDTVSRFGGDEFTILCEGTDEEAASGVAARIAERLSEPFDLDEREVFLNASIGIVVSRNPDDDPEDLLRDADAAMYRAKQQGRSRFALFEGAMRIRSAERLTLENDLRRALEKGELRLDYQPEIELDSGRIYAVEALVRWDHPRHGTMPPNSFIPIAEDSGLIIPLGDWVLREACRQAAAWLADRDGEPSLRLSVNVSPRQLADDRLTEVVREALDRSSIPPSMLRLEITESAAVDGISTLTQLKELGVGLAIDDFGVGFSSLNHIRRLPPVDTLKIDKSFVDHLGRRPSDTAVVAAIVGMARSLSIATVAEGIETAEQVRKLRELGCDRGQGYHFARPAPASAVSQLLLSASLGELISG
ncbi:MAG TPA: EAL domain-containing protein [Solirubrobacteraceae bacterium]|nr:EAL domain-containing protein [Solirubrobacteraceae bacterium]